MDSVILYCYGPDGERVPVATAYYGEGRLEVRMRLEDGADGDTLSCKTLEQWGYDQLFMFANLPGINPCRPATR